MKWGKKVFFWIPRENWCGAYFPGDSINTWKLNQTSRAKPGKLQILEKELTKQILLKPHKKDQYWPHVRMLSFSYYEENKIEGSHGQITKLAWDWVYMEARCQEASSVVPNMGYAMTTSTSLSITWWLLTLQVNSNPHRSPNVLKKKKIDTCLRGSVLVSDCFCNKLSQT